MNFLRALRPIAADFLSTIVFLVLVEVTGDVRTAIIAGIAAGLGQFAFLLIRGHSIALMQYMSLFLVVTLGGASLYLNDPRFVMAKPTIGAWAISVVMLQRGWMLRYLPPRVTDNLSPLVGIAFGYVWAALIFLLGAANLFVAFTYGLQTWAWFTAVVPVSCQLTLFAIQYLTMRHLVIRNIRAAAASA